ncbi:MAG TPA: hypothetical protein VHP83_19580 [Aggregatilineaceae bacterium]|nr:hypothetical protein [Aggregatilineaceae bacterium]
MNETTSSNRIRAGLRQYGPLLVSITALALAVVELLLTPGHLPAKEFTDYRLVHLPRIAVITAIGCVALAAGLVVTREVLHRRKIRPLYEENARRLAQGLRPLMPDENDMMLFSWKVILILVAAGVVAGYAGYRGSENIPANAASYESHGYNYHVATRSTKGGAYEVLFYECSSSDQDCKLALWTYSPTREGFEVIFGSYRDVIFFRVYGQDPQMYFPRW